MIVTAGNMDDCHLALDLVKDHGMDISEGQE